MIGAVLACILLAAAALALGVAIVVRRFRALVAGEIVDLFSDGTPGVGPEQLAARWSSLPQPVRRHLQYAIPRSTPAIRTARLKHDGYFRTRIDQRWFPIQGEEYFTVARPGFVWNASIRLAPLLWIEARDRLLSGRGSMLVKFCSAFTVANASGPEMDQGSILRWLAEAVWFPYGLLGDAIQWQAIDERSARATLIQNGAPVGAIFEVDEEGKIVRVSAERHRDIGGGKTVVTHWIGTYADYREFGGLRIPSQCEVAWVLEEGEFSYARFRVTALEYNLPHRF